MINKERNGAQQMKSFKRGANQGALFASGWELRLKPTSALSANAAERPRPTGHWAPPPQASLTQVSCTRLLHKSPTHVSCTRLLHKSPTQVSYTSLLHKPPTQVTHTRILSICQSPIRPHYLTAIHLTVSRPNSTRSSRPPASMAWASSRPRGGTATRGCSGGRRCSSRRGGSERTRGV